MRTGIAVRRPRLREELLALQANDLQTRARLEKQGLLGRGYHPEMQRVHESNAARLEEVVESCGWPGKSLVDEDGAEAAWLLLQHAVSRPDLMRRCLPLLEQAAAGGEIPRRHVAYLTDRIRFFEGRPQVYGTHYAPDDRGRRTVYALEDAGAVNELRAAVGLEPLPEDARVPAVRAAPPEAVRRERAALAQWARSVGWRKSRERPRA